MQQYHLSNLDCASCALKIEEGLRKMPGVISVNVDFSTASLHLETDTPLDVKSAVRAVDANVGISVEKSAFQGLTLNQTWQRFSPIAISGILLVLGLFSMKYTRVTPYPMVSLGFFVAAYLVSGWKVLRNAWNGVLKGQIFDENFLMSMATLGAFAIGEYAEAVGVMLFFMVGDVLESISVEKSRRSINAVLDAKPRYANLLENGKLSVVQPEDVPVGSTILVKPGEMIPLDGIVIGGDGMIDTAPITGESVPKRVKIEDEVWAGTINQDALLTIRVSHEYANTSIARILELIELASNRKSSTERFITRFAKVYTPIVFGIAALVAILPPLLGYGEISEWLYRAFVILVISCPCALVLSIPLGYFSGIGNASSKGILVKGTVFFDILAKVKTVIFDKTGTLTHGKMQVVEIIPAGGFTKEQVLSIAAGVEQGSQHPLAKSIVRAYKQPLGTRVDELKEIRGMGVVAKVDSSEVLVGNLKLLEKMGIVLKDETVDEDDTAVYVSVEGEYAGRILFSDVLRKETKSALALLRKEGVSRLMILSGDKKQTTQEMAERLEIDEFHAELLPEEKYQWIDSKSNHNEGYTAYIGDGINDGPALARADVGIAMGAFGSDVAIETADVVIMSDDLTKVAEGIRIGKRTRRIVLQNIVFALVVKIGFIVLGVMGIATMWEAVFADVGVALITLLNAMRIMRG